MARGKGRKVRFNSTRPVEMPAVRTTIVGGRPLAAASKTLGEIPRGIEVLVKKAVVDPTFRRMLLSRRAAAAEEIGLALTPQEAMMLDQVPAAQLEAIIARTRVDPSRWNAFLGKAAGVMLAALGASAVGCDKNDGQSAGSRPDGRTRGAAAANLQPVGRPTNEPTSRGVRPDKPLAADVAARLAERAEAATRPATQPTSRPTPIPAPEGIQGIRPDVPLAGGGAGVRAEYPLLVAGEMADRPAASQPTSSPASRPASQPSSRPATNPALSAAQIDELIKQFEDDSFKVREAAQKKLLDQGIAVLPRLREVLLDKNLSAEARSRVESVAFALAATTRPAKPRTPEIRMIAGIDVAGIRAVDDDE